VTHPTQAFVAGSQTGLNTPQSLFETHATHAWVDVLQTWPLLELAQSWSVQHPAGHAVHACDVGSQ
jgi:hypothetical protein